MNRITIILALALCSAPMPSVWPDAISKVSAKAQQDPTDITWIYCVARGADQEDHYSHHRYFTEVWFFHLGQNSVQKASKDTADHFEKWLNKQQVTLYTGISACYVFTDGDEAMQNKQELIDDSQRRGEDVVETGWPMAYQLSKPYKK